MRLHLKIKTDNQIIPFDHQHLLVGCIHKWLGWNDKHGELSLLSFSRLEGAELVKNGFCFKRSTAFFISVFEIELIKKIIDGIRNDPSMFLGLIVEKITIEEDPDLTNKERFYLASPVLIKNKEENRIEHILYNDPRSSECLKRTLQTKMKKVGIYDDSFEISFDTTYSEAKTMLINYRGVKNKTSWCPIIIKGSFETKLFAWNVGLGNSTGIGFGAIK